MVNRILIKLFIVTFLSSCTKENPKIKPIIKSINPTEGKYNTMVTITGSNFDVLQSDFNIAFNEVDAEIISFDNQEILVKVPKGAKSGKVTIKSNTEIFEGPEFEYIITATVSTLAGSTQGFEDGTAFTAKFFGPVASTIDPEGNILVADRQNHRIRKINQSTGQVSTFLGTGISGSLDGDVSEAQLAAPNYMIYDQSGNLFISEGIGRIRKVSPAGQVSIFAGGSTSGYADGDALNAKFNIPVGMAFNSSGDLFVMDQENNRIRKISPNGTVSTFAGDGTSETLDGMGTAAKIHQPWGVAIDALNNLYITEFAAFKVRKVDNAGMVTTIAGSSQGFVDGNIAEAKFSQLYGISLDHESNLYVADGGHRIRKIIGFNKVITIAGDGLPGLLDGDGSIAKFNLPYSVSLVEGDLIIVADRLNFKIRKILLE